MAWESHSCCCSLPAPCRRDVVPTALSLVLQYQPVTPLPVSLAGTPPRSLACPCHLPPVPFLPLRRPVGGKGARERQPFLVAGGKGGQRTPAWGDLHNNPAGEQTRASGRQVPLPACGWEPAPAHGHTAAASSPGARLVCRPQTCAVAVPGGLCGVV